jgi:hypothetical protein
MKYSLARPFVAALATAALTVSSPTALFAQGTTTAAISGVVTSQQGQGIEGAAIQVTNLGTGFSLNVTTNIAGRYFVPGLETGNKYRVTAKRIGFRPMVKNDVAVTLGDVRKIDFIMEQQAAALDEITVTAALDPVIDPARQGTQTTISDSALRRLPTLNRNFTDFVALTPQVSTTLFNGGLSGGGTNNRYNNVQIDGTAEADVFGLGSTGQPGGQANGKSIGLEAVKEYKVMLSPFDVRQGFFAGLLINAVTKSGENEFKGTAFAVNRNANNTRKQTYINDYDQTQYGFSFGGPIIKDRAFFFVSPEFQTQVTPATGIYYDPGNLADTTLKKHLDSALTAVAGYTGLDGSGTFGVTNNENPLQNIFARVDVNLPFNTQFVARLNYGHAEQDIFSRSTASFKLSNNAYFFNSKKMAPAIQLRTLFPNGAYNELMAGYTQIRDRRTPRVRAPELTIRAGAGTPFVVVGSERFSHGNELDQDILEITENFTMPMGDHRITVGTQNQFQKFRNLFAQSTLGVWDFASIDSLRNGLPASYIVGVPLQPGPTPGTVQAGGDGAVRFSSALFSYYVQDEWAVSPKLNVSMGLRADVPVFNDRPPENTAFAAAYPGLSTSNVSSGNAQWSPRFGFNLDATGDGVNQVRGGVGLFTGRPAYVWLSNAFQNSGMGGVGLLTCNTAATVQPFNNTNIATPPAQCANGASAALAAEINLMSPTFRHPQNMRATLAYDRRLSRNWTATGEYLYTKGVNGLFYNNLALAGVQGTNPHEGRVVYSVSAAGAVITPLYKSGGRTQIFEVSNQQNDHAYSITGGVTRRYAGNYMASLFYTNTHAFDVQSFTSSTAFSQIRFGRVTGGDLADQTATRSTFEQRHRIVGQATYTLPSKTDVSVIYYGESGSPFTYIASGDLNGDGLTLNDPIYVPKNAQDNNEIRFNNFTTGGVTYTALQQGQAFERYIESEPCLDKNRGKLLPRNACTDPWINTVNVSARQSFKTYKLQNVTLEVNVFNFLNLINKGWGLQRSVGTSPITLLSATTYTGGNVQTGYPLYTFNPNFVKYFNNNLRSNYQIQTQLRYAF